MSLATLFGAQPGGSQRFDLAPVSGTYGKGPATADAMRRPCSPLRSLSPEFIVRRAEARGVVDAPTLANVRGFVQALKLAERAANPGMKVRPSSQRHLDVNRPGASCYSPALPDCRDAETARPAHAATFARCLPTFAQHHPKWRLPLQLLPKRNWSSFEWLLQFLQTREELQEATAEVVRRVALAGVFWLELRFCPLLHTREGLSTQDALRAVLAGFEDGRRSAHAQALPPPQLSSQQHGVSLLVLPLSVAHRPAGRFQSKRLRPSAGSGLACRSAAAEGAAAGDRVVARHSPAAC